jgi:homoserine dehydrogenase
MILSRIAFGEEPDWQEVEREGITSISSELIEAAEKLGLRFKHIASISNEGSQLKGTVRPVLVGKSHPFFPVEGVENALNVHTDIVGRITLQGPGAGMFPTASAVIEDLVYVCQNKHHYQKTSQANIDVDIENSSAKNFWLIQGVQKNVFHSTIAHVEQLSNEIYLIEAGKEDVRNLAERNEGIKYFEVEGSFENSTNHKEDSITIPLKKAAILY